MSQQQQQHMMMWLENQTNLYLTTARNTITTSLIRLKEKTTSNWCIVCGVLSWFWHHLQLSALLTYFCTLLLWTGHWHCKHLLQSRIHMPLIAGLCGTLCICRSRNLQYSATSSSALADASCMSVSIYLSIYCFNSTIRWAQVPLQLYRCIKTNSVLFSSVRRGHACCRLW